MTIQDLCDRSGISVRTIRFYITEGLVAGPEGRGSNTSYSEEQLTRLLLIRELSLLRLPLVEIRERLERVSPAELDQLLVDARLRKETEDAAKVKSPKDYIGAMLDRAREQHVDYEPSQAPQVQSKPAPDLWRRRMLRPGIELHVSLEAEHTEAQMIEAIEDLAQSYSKRKSRRTKNER